MKSLVSLALAGIGLACATGCATPNQKYNWGTYDSSLYAYYKVPANEPELATALAAIVNGSAATHASVPPGIYAEYGYLLLQQGKAEDAAKYFGLEAQHWPESKVFMDRMIQLSAQTKPAAPTAEAK